MSHEPPSILSTCLGFTPLLSRATARPFLALLPDSWRAAFCLGFYLALSSIPRVVLPSLVLHSQALALLQPSHSGLKPRVAASSLALRPYSVHAVFAVPKQTVPGLGSLAFHPWAFYLSLFEPLPWVESLVRGWGLLLVVG